MQILAKLRKLVRWIQCHVCECDDVTNRDVARFRCVDVNAVLQAESFANVSALSNIVAKQYQYRYLSRSRALRCFESR